MFEIRVEGRPNSDYWLYLELPARVSLVVLDDYLRIIWLECCNHLSAFEINGARYGVEPYTFDAMTDFVFPLDADEAEPSSSEATPATNEQESTSQDSVASEDKGDDEEDLLSETDPFVEAISAFMAENRDRIVGMTGHEFLEVFLPFLYKHAGLPTMAIDVLMIPAIDQQVRQITGRSTHDMSAIEMIETLGTTKLPNDPGLMVASPFAPTMDFDFTMGDAGEVTLEQVLDKGKKFKHEYDFGSTTHLTLQVVGIREGYISLELQKMDDDDDEGYIELVRKLAQNEPPVIPCDVCGKPAAWTEGQWCNSWYCEKHRPKDEEVFLLPVVNSPRVGVCAYGADLIDWDHML
ncbi:MAG: hypothetical protein GYB66_11120 [Chloroflexi bacterium]|nr:hypothetical protein [Chloroflexota bacterium]